MNRWAQGFFGRAGHRRLEGAARLHDEDFSARAGCTSTTGTSGRRDGAGFSASIVDLALYVVNNQAALREAGSSVVLYLPKIQTAEEAALWNDMLSALEAHLGLTIGTIKVYVLVEQIEACFQLMEIRAALGLHFVGFNTGRWDYINSVADAMAWDPDVRQSEHRRHHDDLRLHAHLRGSRAARGEHARPAGPVRAVAGRHGAEHPGRIRSRRRERHEARGRRRRARAARGRERQVGRALEDGPHRPARLGEAPARTINSGERFRRLTYTRGRRRRPDAARAGAAHRPRRARSAQRRAAVRQRLRPGLQAAALKPADFFGNDDVLYLMEDMATGEIRLSILWEWLHKGAALTADDDESASRRANDSRRELFARLLAEEYAKLQQAGNRDVHDVSKDDDAADRPGDRRDLRHGATSNCRGTSTCSTSTLGNHDIAEAKRRIRLLSDAFRKDGTRITENLDFE